MNIQFFIPDISGFSSFVNDTEIEHGQQITKELLETIIDSNELLMDIYEIEGDAIFFYSRDEMFSPDMLYVATKKILANFRKKREELNKNRNCQCGACGGISKLTLKFFVHLDKIDEIKIKHFTKFYGKGLLKVHLLMKNNIPDKEYLLFTEDYLNGFESFEPDLMKEYSYETDLFGKIKVKYIRFE